MNDEGLPNSGLQPLSSAGNETVEIERSRGEKGHHQSRVDHKVLTTLQGCPLSDKSSSITAGPRGPLLMQDVKFMEELAHFNRERIPERVVHAKGAGAHGYFEVTKPGITKYSKASIFSTVGKRTPLFIRFSTVGGESGSADTARDPRGFAVKFYTDEGVWDLVGNNTPIFFIRDPVLFPSFIHTQKRNPQTHLKDPNMFWDFMVHRPETLHQMSFLFGDRGLPDGYRHMNGYGSHTFKLVNAQNEAFYCKFHMKTDQGIKNLDAKTADHLASSDPDYSIRDLFNAISVGNYPTWSFYIQVMPFEDAKRVSFNPFDLTKIWSQKDYPLIEVGRIVLNKNPSNYFAEVEQSAFSPSNLVPGIEPSPDKVLQGRLFAYSDTHRHRLGANFHMIPVNKPRCPVMHPTQRDGPMCVDDNFGATPNYHPSMFSPVSGDQQYKEHRIPAHHQGDVDRYESGDEDNYSQARIFWEKVLDEAARQRLVTNLASHLKDAVSILQEKVISELNNIHPDYANGVKQALKQFAMVPSKL